MKLTPDATLGVLVVVTGAVLMAAGALWKGRAVRPLAPRRARALAWQAYLRALTRSAELAIVSARDAAGHGEPAIVTVEDVVRLAHVRFGYEEVVREHAAAALRHAYERGGCAADTVTDAYSAIQ
ncbi:MULTISPECIES: hypothetical protein [unclassified Streptomyces]|uniref:hypothetical protein n=1 Tax=unclassified Streptomyces TaxID=2593676 RepID=UPI0035D553CF